MSQDLKLPKRGFVNVAVISLCHFVGDYYLNLLPVMLPILALKFGFSYTQCGLLYMIFQVLASFFQAPIGLLADRRNLGVFLPLSILTAGVLSSSIGLCSGPVSLVLIVFGAGLCSSGFHPISGGIVPNISPKGYEVLSTSIYIVGGNIGFALAPFITALYLEHFVPQELIYLSALPVFTAILCTVRRLHVRELPKTAEEGLSLKKIFENHDFLKLVLSIGLRAICYCSLVVYIPLFYESLGISAVTAASVLTTFLTGTAIGGLIVGIISAKFRVKTMVVTSYIVTFIALAVFLLKADASVISFICAFVAGAALYGSTPVAIVWSQRLLPKADSFATSMMLGFTFGIGYTLSSAVGLAADFIGLHHALILIDLPSMVLALVVILKVKSAREC